MSHITKAQEGLAAAEARKWDEAITKLSFALRESPNPAWLIARSKALIGVGRFQDALEDANLAWHKAYERIRRDLLSQAHYRRAVAYYRLKQYANADACCIYAMRISKKFPAVEKEDPVKIHVDEKGFYTVTLADAKKEAETDPMANAGNPSDQELPATELVQAREWRAASALRMQILYSLDRLAPDDEARKVTVTLKPEEKQLSDVEASSKSAAGAASAPAAAAKPTIPNDAPVRLQEFQSNVTISVSIFSKGVNKQKLQVTFSPFSAHLDPIIYPNGDAKPFHLDLWGEINPSESKYTVSPSKVELILKKKTPGKWSQLKSAAKSDETPVVSRDQEMTSKNTVKASDSGVSASEATSDKGKAPATAATSDAPPPTYPTSSRSGPKNWDAVGADEDDEDGKDVNLFFKKLFKNATPEQQRAMMKSFTESNGTSLSTDWNDVKGRTVETVPPEGVEAKKWD